MIVQFYKIISKYVVLKFKVFLKTSVFTKSILQNFFEKNFFLLLSKKLFWFCFNAKHRGLTCELQKLLSGKHTN